MKNFTLRQALIGITCCLVLACSKPATDTSVKRYTIRQFMDIVQIAGGAFSPDESKIIISSKETGIFNAQEIDIKTGAKKALTQSTDNAVFALSYFPNDDRLLYTSDKGGNEINHLYVRNPDGSTIDLIQDSTAKAQFGGVEPQQKTLILFIEQSRQEILRPIQCSNRWRREEVISFDACIQE